MISGFLRKRRGPRPCPGCGRHRRVCFGDPCAHLKLVFTRGEPAIIHWVEAGGGKVAPP
jgi:hypothetical protein